MKFKFRKAVSIELRKKINVREFLLTVDYDSLDENDFGFFVSYLNKSIDKLIKNVDLIKKYKANDYLRLQFDSAYCKLYDIEPLEVSEIVSKMAQNNENIAVNNSLTLKGAIEKYLEDCKVNREIQAITLHSYNLQFKHLKDFFKEDKKIEEISQEEVEKFNILLSEKMIVSSRKSLISFYKTFFNFLVEKKCIKYNEFNTIKITASSKSQKEAFTSKEVLKLIELSDKKIKKQKKDINLNLAIRLAAFSGMRMGEIANIKMRDIDLKNKFLYVSLPDTATKKHQRFIPLHSEVIVLIKEMFKTKKADDNLVYNDFSKKSKMSNMNQDLNQYFIKKHIKRDHVSFHSFRHSFRVQCQMTNPELETYIDIVMCHTNDKNRSIGFKNYGHNSADWNKIDDTNYNKKFNNNFQQMFLDRLEEVA